MVSSHLSCVIEQNGLLAWVYCDIEEGNKTDTSQNKLKAFKPRISHSVICRIGIEHMVPSVVYT